MKKIQFPPLKNIYKRGSLSPQTSVCFFFLLHKAVHGPKRKSTGWPEDANQQHRSCPWVHPWCHPRRCCWKMRSRWKGVIEAACQVLESWWLNKNQKIWLGRKLFLESFFLFFFVNVFLLVEKPLYSENMFFFHIVHGKLAYKQEPFFFLSGSGMAVRVGVINFHS